MSEKFDFAISQEDMAKSVTKIGGGHPGQPTISALLSAIDSDPEWYPGKNMDEKDHGGRPPLFTPQMKQAVANAAMALKREGFEPTANAVAERCPIAATNPETGEAFSDKVIHEVFGSRCFDDGAEEPWGHMEPYHKTALSPEAKMLRLKYSVAEEGVGNSGAWYNQNVVWVDPCATILSDSLKIGFDENQASYGRGKRWMSPDMRGASRNLRASPYANKQARYGDEKVFWFVILARGKVGYLIMRRGWRQTGAGMAEFVDQLEDKLKSMLRNPSRLPRVIGSDRGPGFYQSSTGHIVVEYNDALKRNGFRAYAGEDASKQPADMADVWPHETAVSWIRAYLKKHPLQKGCGIAAMKEAFARTMNDCMSHINAEYDVADLSACYPKRMADLRARKGERLKY